MAETREPTASAHAVSPEPASGTSPWTPALTDETAAFRNVGWPLIITCGIGLVAYTDWRVATNVSVGYLYIIPLVLAGTIIHQRAWLLCFVAMAAVLRETLGPFELSGWPLLVRSVIVPSVYAFIVLLVHRIHERQRRLSALVDQQRRQLSRDIEDAAAVQQLLIPSRMPDVPGWDVAARLYPARVVSGDYFDVRWNEPERKLVLVIADIGGKGAAAAMLMPVVQATVRRLHAEGHAPGALAASLNDMVAGLTDHYPRLVSLVFATVETETGALTYVNVGHPPPLLAKGSSGSSWQWLTEGGPIAGALPDAQYQVGREHLDAGDALIFYTDGVSEAENTQGERFSERGVAATALGHAGHGALQVLEGLHEAVEAFQADPSSRDDMTLIVLRRQHAH